MQLPIRTCLGVSAVEGYGRPLSLQSRLHAVSCPPRWCGCELFLFLCGGPHVPVRPKGKGAWVWQAPMSAPTPTSAPAPTPVQPRGRTPIRRRLPYVPPRPAGTAALLLGGPNTSAAGGSSATGGVGVGGDGSGGHAGGPSLVLSSHRWRQAPSMQAYACARASTHVRMPAHACTHAHTHSPAANPTSNPPPVPSYSSIRPPPPCSDAAVVRTAPPGNHGTAAAAYLRCGAPGLPCRGGCVFCRSSVLPRPADDADVRGARR